MQCCVATCRPALAGVSGLYFVDYKPVIPESNMPDEQAAL